MASLKTSTAIITPIQTCKCGTRIDVSKFGLFQEVTCPSCGQSLVVKGRLDRFELIGLAGQGGAGSVYVAFDAQLGRQIALKVVRPDRVGDEEILAQLESEALVTASLNHPNVLRVFSVGRDQERFFIAMELIHGGTLEDLLRKHRVLPEIQALEIALQIASGLKAAYMAGLIHRDVKPGNVLFLNSTAKVMDFGLAVFEQFSAGAEGSVWGSPAYMPPERLEGMAEDFRGDIYALGTVLFEMLTGRPTFDASTAQEVAMKRLHHPAPSVLTFAPGISNATAFVVKKMLEKDREARFRSYDELIDSLKFAREELKQKKNTKTARVVLDAGEHRKIGSWMTIAFAAFFLIAAIVAVVLVRKSRARDAVTEIPSIPAPALSAKASNAIPATASKAPSAAGVLRAGVYRIVNSANNWPLHVGSYGIDNNAHVTTWNNGNMLNSQWVARPTEGGYQIVAFHSCKALQIGEDLADSRSALRHSNWSGDARQLWNIEHGDNGAFRIVSKASGKVLSLVDKKDVAAVPVGQSLLLGPSAGQWKIEFVRPVPAELASVLDGSSFTKLPLGIDAKLGKDPKGSQFEPINLKAVANRDSRNPKVFSSSSGGQVIRLQKSGWVDVNAVPFQILNAANLDSGNDQIVLQGWTGPTTAYPSRVEIPVDGAPLTKLHFLGGIAGWGHVPAANPMSERFGVAVVNVTVTRKGGGRETFQLRNGMEILNWNTKTEVPHSTRARGVSSEGDARYFVKELTGIGPVEQIILESATTVVVPIFIAITGEKK